MGVWTIGRRSRAVALADQDLRRACRKCSPEIPVEMISGSPYAIADYRVTEELGGEGGLKQFRERLHKRGIKLVLDFVPNHVGLDHRWVIERPELFVQAEQGRGGVFRQETRFGPRWLAHGRDPNFSPWADTVQLDYRRSATWFAMQEILHSIAERCDGVRCDMAMLVLKDVFAGTWDEFPACDTPAWEFWPEAIESTKRAHRDFLFLAEVYWGMESRLQSLGFDYTYDKVLYDEIIRRNPAAVQQHLLGAAARFVEASAHFLENHDEARIASILDVAEHRAAALLNLALPGMRLMYEGQLTGARLKQPVQVACVSKERVQPEIEQMYRRFFSTLKRTAIGAGSSAILKPTPASPENKTAVSFVLIQWQAKNKEFDLAVVNLAPHRGQCFAPLQIQGLADCSWRMEDLLGPERYERDGSDLEKRGLYLDVPGHGAQLFQFSPII